MTNEEKINAVTTMLTGEFYTGQRVRHRSATTPSGQKYEGVVVEFRDPLNVIVQWDNSGEPSLMNAHARNLILL